LRATRKGRGFEAGFDELADGFGAGWEAIGPSVIVDLVDEFFWHGDDEAFGFFGFAGHGLDLCIGGNMA
jgi:hypothetical protein